MAEEPLEKVSAFLLIHKLESKKQKKDAKASQPSDTTAQKG